MKRHTTCCQCGKHPLEKNEIGLNKKLLDPNPAEYYCLECLAQYLEVEPEYLIEKIKAFKEQGCTLF